MARARRSLLGPRSAAERAALHRAHARLGRLDWPWLPRPVDLRHVRIVHTPWLFRVPGFRRFVGYELGPLVLLKAPLDEVHDDLLVHELCHVWQHQHRPVWMWLTYLWQGYRANEHEVEARAAARVTGSRSGRMRA